MWEDTHASQPSRRARRAILIGLGGSVYAIDNMRAYDLHNVVAIFSQRLLSIEPERTDERLSKHYRELRLPLETMTYVAKSALQHTNVGGKRNVHNTQEKSHTFPF